MKATDLDRIDIAFRSLLHGEYSGLSLVLNDYLEAGSYNPVTKKRDPVRVRTVAESMSPDWYDPHDDSWINSEDTALAIKHNTFWRLVWFPDTPVGSCHLDGYSLSDVMRIALEDELDIEFDPTLWSSFDTYLRGLIKPGDQIYIDLNDYKTCYTSTENRVAEILEDTWVSPEEKALVLATNTLWEIAVTPGTYRASTLQACFLKLGDS
jgi:hypothetical protein